MGYIEDCDRMWDMVEGLPGDWPGLSPDERKARLREVERFAEFRLPMLVWRDGRAVEVVPRDVHGPRRRFRPFAAYRRHK